MAPMDVMHSLLEQEDALTFTQGEPVVLRCNCLQIGRESLPLCVGNMCELHDCEVHATVLNCDAWSSVHTVLRPTVMYVSEWRPSRRVDKKERSCSFLEKDEQKLP